MHLSVTAARRAQPRQAVSPPFLFRFAKASAAAIIVLAIVSGVFIRAWYLWHRPISSDESVVGLTAGQILHGHLFAFSWGRAYGGVEPYLTAAGFGVFGHSPWVLRAIPLLLSAVAALLAWRVTKRLVGDSVLAALAGAIVWAAPDSSVSNSSIESGFRGATLVCGLVVLLLVLRILDDDNNWLTYGGLGLFAGIGWWSSPEIAYFLVPAGLMLLAFLWSKRDSLVGLLPRVGLMVVAAGIGAIPWLYANAGSGFRSLKTSEYGSIAGGHGYGERFHTFFHQPLGLLFSLRDMFDGDWLGGKTVGLVLLVVILVALGVAWVFAFVRGGRAIAIAVGMVAFPFILALAPRSWFWQTGRYTGYVVPLYVMVFAIGAYALARLISSSRRYIEAREAVSAVASRLILGVVGVSLTALALASFVQDPTPGVSVTSSWGDPNKATTNAISVLEKAKVSTGYANYWAAYRLDFLSHEHLKLTPGHNEVDRWPVLNGEVSADGLAAWVFVEPSAIAASQFMTSGGPSGIDETTFASQLKARGIGYRVVGAGILDAVIPNSPISANDFWPTS